MMRTRAGFTLLEVLVALVILAVGIIGVVRLFPLSMRQSQIAAERTTVASLARSELGRIRAGGVYQSDFQSWIRDWAEDNALRTIDEATRAYTLYDSWRASVQRIGSRFGDGIDLFRITFSVKMFDGREETFVTYVTEL